MTRRAPIIPRLDGGEAIKRAKIPVILDTDPGHDDAVALAFACAAPEIEVRAVTTVAGNASLPATTENALRVLHRIGCSNVPVAAGAGTPTTSVLYKTGENIHGEGGLGSLEWGGPDLEPDRRGAVRLMADILESSAEPVTLVAIGPLTNVATFLERFPHLKGKLERIVLMGGSVGPGNVTPAAEFNIYVDPEAARAVFSSGLLITMVGLDVGRRAVLGPEKVEHVRKLGGVGEAVAEIMGSYAESYTRATGSNSPPPVYDAAAIAAVVEPGVLGTRSMRVEIECEGEFTRGETVCDLRGAWGMQPNVEVGMDLEEEIFFEVLYRSLKGSAVR